MKNIIYINAGAGSGKTYNLTNILAEKLADKSVDIKPSQVILTTFTELAAKEFREKAREQLLSGNKKTNLAPNVEAASQIDSAAIGTVHSVALQFLKRFWYLLDYGPDIQIMSDRDADFYMSQSLAKIVKNKPQELDIFKEYCDYFGINGDNNRPDYLFWQTPLKEIVEKMMYYDVNDLSDSKKKTKDMLSSVFKYAVNDADMDTGLREYISVCKKFTTNEAHKQESFADNHLRIPANKRNRQWRKEVLDLVGNFSPKSKEALSPALNALKDIKLKNSSSLDNALSYYKTVCTAQGDKDKISKFLSKNVADRNLNLLYTLTDVIKRAKFQSTITSAGYDYDNFEKDFLTCIDFGAMDKILKVYGDCYVAGSNEANIIQNRIKVPIYQRDVQWFSEAMKCPEFQKAEKLCPGYKTLKAAAEESLASKDDYKVLSKYVDAIFDVAKAWKEDFENYKKDHHVITYNDIEQKFYDLLKNEQEVQNYVKDNIKLIMVDEFQDSNPMQLKIFAAMSDLIAENGGISFWVGDPKQAIYGFRGSDTELVKDATKEFDFTAGYKNDEIPRNIPQSQSSDGLVGGILDESWRSRETLVNFVNNNFVPAFAKDGIPKERVKLNAHFNESDEKEEGLNIPALMYWEDNTKNQSQYVEELARNIKNLHDSREEVHHSKRDKGLTPLKWGDIAVLCHSNSHCRNLVKALRNAGIPVSEAEDNIIQRIEVQLVINLLLFAENPNDKYVIANLLRLLEGQSTTDILIDRIKYLSDLKANEDGQDEEKGKDEWKKNDSQLLSWKSITSRQNMRSIPELVEAIIYEFDLPTVVDKWEQGNDRRANLATVEELAHDYDKMCLQMGLGASISGFINYLNTVEPEGKVDNQADAVKVLTYHGSKGLEWAVVILTDLDYNPLDDKDFTKKSFTGVHEIPMDDSDNANPLEKTYYINYFPRIISSNSADLPEKVRENILPDPTNNGVTPSIAQLLYSQMKERQRSELRRLMYVGMTRAKDCLCLAGNFSKEEWFKNIGINPEKENPWVTKIYPAKESTDIAENIVENAMKPTCHNQFGDKYLSPSKIENIDGYKAFTSFKALTDEGKKIDCGNSKDYVKIGLCIHNFFAVYSYGAPDNKEKARQIIKSYGMEDVLESQIDNIIASANYLYEYLCKSFANGHSERELPFTYCLPDGKVLRGEIDLLWHYETDDKKKHCVLVDYKSYAGDNTYEEIKKHYAQLSTYAHVLEENNINVEKSMVYYPVFHRLYELK